MTPFRLVAFLSLTLTLPMPGRAADVEPLLPADTTSYLSVNIRQIVDSDLFKKQLLDPARDALKEMGDVQAILDDLGIDPFKHLDRLILASPGGNETDRGLIVVHGTFDEVKFKKKAEQATRDHEDVLKLHKVPLGGGVTYPVYEVVIPNQDLSIYVALASNRTLIASPGKDYIVDALKARDRKTAVLKNRDLQALLEKLDPKLGLSVAMLGKSLAKAAEGMELLPRQITESLADVEAIGGGIAVTNEVRLDIVVAGKDDASARTIREGLDRGLNLGIAGLTLLADSKELGVLRDVLKTIRVGGRGKIVSVTGRLTADVLDDFLKKE